MFSSKAAREALNSISVKAECFKARDIRVEYSLPITESHIKIFIQKRTECENRFLRPCHLSCEFRGLSERRL